VLINAFFVAQESGRLLKVESSLATIYHDDAAALALSEESTALRLVGNHITEGISSPIRPDALARATDLSIGIPITCSIARAAALHSIPRFSDRSSFTNSRQALKLDSEPTSFGNL
jgi:hypothetical protein